ncbi:MAG: mechanosensitive ion channel domain-containing protein [Pseudomonadales bacterium]
MDSLSINLSAVEWASHGLLLLLNLAFFVGAGAIIRRTQGDHDHSERVQIARTLSAFICVLVIADIVVLSLAPEISEVFMSFVYSLMTVYFSLLVFQISSYYSLKRFGRRKEVDSRNLYVETYSSRLMNIVLIILIGIVTLFVVIKVWGADSMLETTGIFGIIFAFLAFTSANWAPDVLSGLVILNSQTLEDGDLIKIDGYDDEYIISKVSFIYTVIFDIRNNNRTLIRNSRMMQGKIDNLSRIASSDGIRQALRYNIGYPKLPTGDREARIAISDAQTKNVNDVFEKAFQRACEDEAIKINGNKTFEWALTEAGDYALEYTLWIYLERIPSTKVTATIRKHYLGTIYKVNELVYRASVEEEIDLSTPDLSNMTVTQVSA